MIELKFGSFRDPSLINALARLYHVKKCSTLASYKIAKIKQEFDKEQGIVQNLFIELVKKYADLDEKGGFIPAKDPEGKDMPGTYNVPENKKADWEEAFKQFQEQKIEINRKKLTLKELESAELPPSEVDHLMPFLDASEED